MKERSLNRFLKLTKCSLMQRKGNYVTKDKSKQLKKVDQVVVLASSWTSLICFLEKEEGCREKEEDKFPPNIYYKIFTERHIEDLCANSPRDYTKLSAKYKSHIKSDNLQEGDQSGWYHRTENNGWRPVSDTFWMSPEDAVVGDKKESKFHFSKLKRRQDMEKKRKIRKIEWMRQMYYGGHLEAKSTNQETLGLIHTATKGLIQSIEDGGIDSVMEWEVDEVLNWTNTLNFDE
uniref:Uncharacterized protein n=1 Tax=Molossus molossus TaxID=27622 RepID=A0A7J8ENI2_MOLMO|nr:hypothetical protein HJG59_001666 [Molossus molossus]